MRIGASYATTGIVRHTDPESFRENENRTRGRSIYLNDFMNEVPSLYEFAACQPSCAKPSRKPNTSGQSITPFYLVFVRVLLGEGSSCHGNKRKMTKLQSLADVNVARRAILSEAAELVSFLFPN